MDAAGGRTFSGQVLRIVTETPQVVGETVIVVLDGSSHPEVYLGRFQRGAQSRGGRAWIADVGEFHDVPKDEAVVLYARPLVAGQEEWGATDASLTALDSSWPEPGRVGYIEYLSKMRQVSADEDPWMDPLVCARLVCLWALSDSHAYLLGVPVGVDQVPSQQAEVALERLRATVGDLRQVTAPWFDRQSEHIANGISLYWRRVREEVPAGQERVAGLM